MPKAGALPRKSTHASRASTPIPAAPAETGWTLATWQAWIAFAVIVLAGAGRIASTYDRLSITYDEPIHLACGLEYLSKHQYQYETQHPPLERAMGALLPYLSGMRTTGAPNSMLEARALLRWKPRFGPTLTQMRLGVLPFFFIAAAILFLWARRCFGATAAVAAAAVFTLIPPVLAHAGLATTDIALTACLGAAFYSLARWAETPTIPRALLLALWTALAVLSKFSTLVFLPASAALALGGFVVLRRPRAVELWTLAKRRMATFALAVATAAVIIWGGYFFSFGPVPAWQRGRSEGFGVEARPAPAFLRNLRVPAPALFDGIQAVIDHNRQGHAAYFLGGRSDHGSWQFFPVMIAVKTPIPILILFVAGIVAGRLWRDVRGWLVLAFLGGVLGAGMAGHINIGLRHVLPVFLPIAMAAGAGLVRAGGLLPSRFRVLAIAAVLVAIAAAGMRQHPDYVSYMNAFAGAAPEEVAADSDLEWGQGYKLLSERLKSVGARVVTLRMMDFIIVDQPWVQKEYGLPAVRPFDPVTPDEGWTALSPTVAGTALGGWSRNEAMSQRLEGKLSILNESWTRRLDPTERVGGFLLYYIAPAAPSR